MVGAKRAAGIAVVLGVLGIGGAVAASGRGVELGGRSSGREHGAELSCPGGMVHLGHVLTADVPIFPDDPVPTIEPWATIADDGFKLERVSIGTHTGTHLSAPGHFIDGAANVDELPARDFVWPAYVLDLRARTAANPDFQVTRDELRAYERRVGRVPQGAMVILYTGFQDRWPGASYRDTAPGIAADAVDWLFEQRSIKGVASDTFGPDASSDTNFDASTAVYTHGGTTIENIAGLDQLHLTGDLVFAPTTRLKAGSGYQNNPIGCLRA